MNIKSASSLDFGKSSEIVNVIMHKINNAADAKNVLTVDGMFGYVLNEGIFLNVNGGVEKISNASASASNASAFYQSTTPPSTGLKVGMLWYNTSTNSLSIWANTNWLAIGGVNQANLLTTWTANVSYSPNQIVEYNGNIWKNITGNTIASPTFVLAEWKNLTGATIKTYDLMRTHAVNTTANDVSLNADGTEFKIQHSCNTFYPQVDVLDRSTNERLVVDLMYIDVNNLQIKVLKTLSTLGIDLKVRILC